jgi:hypothetical protein
LLGRLNGPDDLDALSSRHGVDLLHQLAPTQREKLARRFRQEFENVGATIDVDALVERLKDIAFYLEMESASASDLASQVEGMNRRQALRALVPLVEAGFVVRGRSVRCPTCNVADFVRLSELDERVRCPACRAEYLLPVLETGGGQEPPTHFRLDGLMARVMDQDVLPVMLALRKLHKTIGVPHHPTYFWPGVEIERNGKRVDVDLLAFNGDVVICCECKLTGETLHTGQLQNLLELADHLQARPVLAALNGRFSQEHRAEVDARGGWTYHRGDLLD